MHCPQSLSRVLPLPMPWTFVVTGAHNVSSASGIDLRILHFVSCIPGSRRSSLRWREASPALSVFLGSRLLTSILCPLSGRLIATYHLHVAARAAPLPALWDFPIAHGAPMPAYVRVLSADPSNTNTTPTNPSNDSNNTPTQERERPHDRRQDDRDGRRQDDRERTGDRDRHGRGRGGAGVGAPAPWEQRMMYITARDTREMELLMSVCPQWGVAVEAHPFWHAALALFDPYGHCANYGWTHPPAAPPSQHSSAAAPAPIRLSPYRHFRAVLSYACLPCRVNAPRSTHGLTTARRSAPAPRVGMVALCREHHGARRGRWCGVCFVDGELARMVRLEALRNAQEELARAENALRAARWEVDRAAGVRAAGGGSVGERALEARQAAVDRAFEVRDGASEALARAQAAEAAAGGAGGDVGIAENEDEATFPNAHATCRACRAEWLWRSAVHAAAPPSPTPSSTSSDSSSGGAPYDRGAELLGALGCAATSTGGVYAFTPQDPLVRAAVGAFVDLGEGTVQHVLVIAGERGWLRAQTRWAELMGQALAARRFNAGDRALSGGNDRGRGGGGGGGGGAGGRIGEDGKPDYTGFATVRFVKSKRRRRSLSVESLDESEFLDAADYRAERATRAAHKEATAYLNTPANAAAYARAGYTNTNATGELEEEYDDEYEDDSELDLDLEEEEEDEMEDEEALAAALETSVRELALGDWARGRILDGAWVAPADVYYNMRVGGLDGPDDPVKAVHPVPWAVSPPSSPSPSAQPLPGADDAPAAHPGAPAPPPPTYVLAEAAHNAHVRQMRAVLLPAFRNVVRRVIVECSLDAAEAPSSVPGGARRVGPLDPAVRAARMGLADVVREVREEEGVWFDGVDWRERRRNAQAEADAGAGGHGDAEGERRHRGEGSDDSSEGTSRTSDTSPVLSTSTLGTTPSPPPLGEHRADKDKAAARDREREADDAARERLPTIAVMPVLDPPRLLRPIPYVPETIAHLPPYSLEALRAVWREACAPLYHCRCSICERAMAVAQAAQGGNPAAASTAPTTTTRPSAPEHTHAHSDGPIVVHLPAEDDSGGRGADSVVSLVAEGDDGYYLHKDGGVADADADAQEEAISAQEAYWRQMDEQEGPGAYEREMALIAEMREGRLVSDDDEYSEEGDFEEEEGADGDGAGAKYALSPSAWVAGRKRSVDELEPEAGAEGGDAHAVARGGTPPKRARTGERDYTTVRLVKRRSEELDAEVTDATDADTASAGSAPKRARLEAAESPPDTSTPGSGEESAYEATTYARVGLEDVPPIAK
ncbi:hypothetical protein FB451DRAFT_1571923 [Mycena latifolia]|nr:hypothetical protein FB451DRAFT_1571923 [Mycena latifolia]